jgi:hypothetical protein
MKAKQVNRPEDGAWNRVKRVLSDPYYYALALPSFLLNLFASLVFLAFLGFVVALVWYTIRTISLGAAPDFSEAHPRMFIAGGFVSMFPLIAGVLSRRMTRPEIRGKFVQFSKKIQYRNGHLLFTVIDMRKTQLIGLNVVLEIISGRSDDIVCRRVNLGSPGIIAIPTEIRVPIGSVFPSLNQVVSCDICGRSKFSTFKTYASHMAYYHGVSKSESVEDILKSLEAELANLRLLRVVLTGADEISGKGGIATKEFKRSDISLHGFVGTEDSFSVKTGGTEEVSSSSGDDEVSTTLSAKSSYIHVDFRNT